MKKNWIYVFLEGLKPSEKKTVSFKIWICLYPLVQTHLHHHPPILSFTSLPLNAPPPPGPLLPSKHTPLPDCPFGWGCRIYRRHLCRGVRVLPTSVQLMTLNNLEMFQELWGMRDIPSLPSLPGSQWPGEVAPDRVLSLSQIGLNCALMLKWTAWNIMVLTLNWVWTNTILTLNWIVWITTVWLNWIAWNRNVFDN